MKLIDVLKVIDNDTFLNIYVKISISENQTFVRCTKLRDIELHTLLNVLDRDIKCISSSCDSSISKMNIEIEDEEL